MRLVQVGTLVLSGNMAQDATDSYPARARDASIDMRNGAYDHDGETVFWQSSKVSRRFFISGTPNEIEERSDWLKRFMAYPRQVGFFDLRDGRRRATYLKGASITPVADTARHKYRQDFTLEWTRDYPFYMDNDHVDFLDTGLVLDGSWAFDGNYDAFTFAASPFTFSINYNGSVDGRLNTVTIVPQAGGSISNILLENLTNGMSWRYTGTVAATTRLDVDNMTKSVWNNSTEDMDNFEWPDDKQLEIMTLSCQGNGGNNFRLTATIAGTIDLYFRWIGEFL